jgi:hypothetical protein
MLFGPQASARRDEPGQQVIEPDGLTVPAVTLTEGGTPAAGPAFLRGRDTDFRIKHLKSPEPLTGHDLQFPLLWHVDIVST